MVAPWKTSADWSKQAFETLVWPAIHEICGGGEVRYTENSGHETDRHLDILAGVDAYQVLGNVGIRGIASRIQEVPSWDTFTLRYERHSRAGFETEYKKRLEAVRSNGELLCAYLFVQAYVSKDLSELASVAVVRVRDLFEFAEKDRLSYTDEKFPRESGSGCYLKTVRNDGSADFVVVPWRRMRQAGIKVETPKALHARKKHATSPGGVAQSPNRKTWDQLFANDESAKPEESRVVHEDGCVPLADPRRSCGCYAQVITPRAGSITRPPGVSGSTYFEVARSASQWRSKT